MGGQKSVQKHANPEGVQDRMKRWIAFGPYGNAVVNSIFWQELELHGARKHSKGLKSTYDIVKEMLDEYPHEECLKRKVAIYEFLHNSHCAGIASIEGTKYVKILEESLGDQKKFERVTSPVLLQQTANEIRWASKLASKEVEKARERLPNDIESAIRRTLLDPPAKPRTDSA